MKKGIFCVLFGLLIYVSCSTALAAQYDFFGRFIPEGTPTINGVITPGEWNEMGHITLYKFYGEDAKIEIYLMWDQTNLYLGADIQDFELWVDNFNPATYWESTWDDDAFKCEIDPDYSRDQTLQPNDRVFAVNATD